MINFHHILPEYYSNTFNYYFYSRVDTRQEPINRIKHIEDLGTFNEIIVNFNLENITPQLYQHFICNIQHIIDDLEDTGEFEYDCFKITVYNKIDQAPKSIIVSNPEIKSEHKYTTH